MNDYTFKVTSKSGQLQIDGNSEVYYLAGAGNMIIDNIDYITKVLYSKSIQLTYPLVFFKPNTGRYSQFGWQSRNGNIFNGFYMESQMTSVTESIDWKLYFPYSLSSVDNEYGLKVYNSKGEPSLKDFGVKLILKKIIEITMSDTPTWYIDIEHSVNNAYFLLDYIPTITYYTPEGGLTYYKLGLKKISEDIVRIGWSIFPSDFGGTWSPVGSSWIFVPPIIRLLVIGD